MGETLPTSVAPSARSLLWDKQSSTKERAGIYTLGNPRPTHQELRWGELEAQEVAEVAKRLGLPNEFKLREDASHDWLIKKALKKGYIVDASCHGGFDLREPLQSALLLAEKKRLTLGEMLSHEVDLRGLRLLILSACQTAILDLRGAHDEVHSLAAGMVQAGAQAVLATLWKVDGEAAYWLIVRFVQEWLPHLESESPAAALARAQHWLRTVTNHKFQQRQLSGTNQGWMETVDGHGQYSDTDEIEPVASGSYSLMDEAERRVQKWVREQDAPIACRYADPIYWAVFQLTGW